MTRRRDKSLNDGPVSAVILPEQLLCRNARLQIVACMQGIILPRRRTASPRFTLAVALSLTASLPSDLLKISVPSNAKLVPRKLGSLHRLRCACAPGDSILGGPGVSGEHTPHVSKREMASPDSGGQPRSLKMG